MHYGNTVSNESQVATSFGKQVWWSSAFLTEDFCKRFSIQSRMFRGSGYASTHWRPR